jgi:hypothetical protein
MLKYLIKNPGPKDNAKRKLNEALSLDSDDEQEEVVVKKNKPQLNDDDDVEEDEDEDEAEREKNKGNSYESKGVGVDDDIYEGEWSNDDQRSMDNDVVEAVPTTSSRIANQVGIEMFICLRHLHVRGICISQEAPYFIQRSFFCTEAGLSSAPKASNARGAPFAVPLPVSSPFLLNSSVIFSCAGACV